MTSNGEGRGGAPAPGVTASDLRSSLAMNVKRFRAERGWTLRELSERSGVSKALLSRIERGDGNPSMETLFRMAAAFGCAVSEVIEVETSRLDVVRADEGRMIVSEDGAVRTRLILAGSDLHRIEIFDMAMDAGGRSQWEGRPEYQVTEFAVVREGRALVGPVGEEALLGPGDAIAFRHDVQNVYQALEQPVRIFSIVAYGP